MAETATQQESAEHVVQIRRCACVVKGGRRFSFAALVVVGDRNGRVGWGYGKAPEVPQAVEKAVKKAERLDATCQSHTDQARCYSASRDSRPLRCVQRSADSRQTGNGCDRRWLRSSSPGCSRHHRHSEQRAKAPITQSIWSKRLWMDWRGCRRSKKCSVCAG